VIPLFTYESGIAVVRTVASVDVTAVISSLFLA
jgi:hypothetical protein